MILKELQKMLIERVDVPMDEIRAKESILMERVDFSAVEMQAIAKKVYEMAAAEAHEEASGDDGVVSARYINSYAKTIVQALSKRILVLVDDIVERETLI